jgi:TetR/AcrR family transcriptional repressor of nem operon
LWLLDILNRTVHNAAMARPIEFDRSLALNKALVLFWRKGYQASSLADLLQAMEISRSSLYAAFGDKRRLFLECLELFAQRTKDILQQARVDKPPVEALRSFFEFTSIGPRRSKAGWGCMLVNTVLETAGVDDELSARASDLLTGVQAAFEDCLREAGCTPERAAELAAFLMLVNEGIRVSSRRKLSRRQQLDQIDTTFRLLGSATA